jgi:hypothetical protein
VTRIFAFGANISTSGLKDDVEKNPLSPPLLRAPAGNMRRSPQRSGQYAGFRDQIGKMWENEPNWTDAQLREIRTTVVSRAIIVGGLSNAYA